MKTGGLLAVIMAFSIFGAKAQTSSSEEAFWQWFAKNERRLFEFEADRERIFDELGKQMKKVNPNLTFEFGPIHDGKREFVVSAGGIKSAFPAVESLYAKAPSLSRWIWVKYRPRRLPLNDLRFGGKEIKVDDVRYLLAKDGDKVGIVLFFDGYTEHEKRTFGQFGYLFLDEALGEYAVETQVGFIEFHGRDSQYFARSHPLRELPAHFDEHFGRKVH
jgi:hypothetical protein